MWIGHLQLIEMFFERLKNHSETLVLMMLQLCNNLTFNQPIMGENREFCKVDHDPPVACVEKNFLFLLELNPFFADISDSFKFFIQFLLSGFVFGELGHLTSFKDFFTLQGLEYALFFVFVDLNLSFDILFIHQNPILVILE